MRLLEAKASHLRVRPARAADHAAFVRLFPELAVDDPTLDEEQFVQKLMPETLVAEAGEGPDPAHVVGYAFFQIMKDLAYVRHLVTAPEARRKGVGRALLTAIVQQARDAGCLSWCLNVKPDNTAALALYTSFGLSPAFKSRALKLAWSSVRSLQSANVTARLIEPEDDAAVEAAMRLATGQLANVRRGGGRVLMGLHEGTTVVGAAVFDPKFPGAYPFRVARPELAMNLLEAIRPYALPEHDRVNVVTEGQPDVADALLAAGAILKMDSVHMKGALPVMR
jgi:ribosomal protein S18 acetylase RimI-like enzyme